MEIVLGSSISRWAKPLEPMILLGKASTKIACNGGVCLGAIGKLAFGRRLTAVDSAA